MAETVYKAKKPFKQDGKYYYPITTADQVIVDKDTRLNAVGVYLENIDNSTDTTVYGNNATTLGGVAAEDYALKTDTAPDSSKLGGKTLAEIMLALYPVGAVYISANSTSPASLFGGTWEQLKDRFLLGAGSTYSAGSTGGEATHKLTTNEIPSHAGHLYGNAGGVDGKGDAKGAWLKEINVDSTINTSYGWNYKNNEYYPANRSLGGNAAHNNMPPYLAVYMWKRVS